MKRLVTAIAALLIGATAYAGETINGKPVALGAAGIPYVVGGTDQENWIVRQRQHLEDKALIAEYDWPAPASYAIPASTTVNIIIPRW